MIGGIEETSASFEARSAPRSYPTNNTAVAFDPAAGLGEARRTLLTDENVEEVGIRFDRLTLPADAKSGHGVTQMAAGQPR
jgi:hypothetical protein